MTLRLIALVGLLVPMLATANNTKQSTYTFEDGDTISMPLSSLDVNKIRVKSDRIISIICPTGFCTNQNNAKDKTGSVAVKVNIQAPFTAQVTTEKGRLFALLINPKATPGQIVELTYAQAHLDQKSIFERQFDYPQALTEFTKAMMLWKRDKTPVPGFRIHFVDPDTLPEDTGPLPLTPQVVFSGKDYSGIIYQVTNQTSQTKTLTRSQFYSYAARSASLDSLVLAPGESTTLYLITGGGVGHVK
ncbi:type-F conjugative transfer system secretin TraK (plasmid) [Vibrio coralliilyticus]|nr:type-F conjugative transfer system secretin TraK [Vibrio coralliilyticus]